MVWGAHFGALYAIHAVACERDFARLTWIGLGFVPGMIGAATLAALLALALLAHPSFARGPWPEGEPDFRTWLTAAACAMAATAVVFQAMPVIILPVCVNGH